MQGRSVNPEDLSAAAARAIRDAVAVAAVRRGDPAARLERGADADRDGLRARVVVDGTDRRAGVDELLQALLELADQRHAVVDEPELLTGQLGPAFGRNAHRLFSDASGCARHVRDHSVSFGMP